MKTWKLVAGIVSMLASTLVLTSVITSLRDFAGTSAQPRGLVTLALAAALLGLAGIVQIVFRDGVVDKANLGVMGLYAGAFVFFVLTVILGTFDTAGWIQIVAFVVWSAGCASYTWLERSWSKPRESGSASDVAAPASSVEEKKKEEASAAPAMEATADAEEEKSVEEPSFADLPPVPEVGEALPVAMGSIPPRPGEVAEGSVWDSPEPPPRF